MTWYDIIWFDMILYDICACVRVNRTCWKTMENHRCWLKCHVKRGENPEKPHVFCWTLEKSLVWNSIYSNMEMGFLYIEISHGSMGWQAIPPATATGDLWRPGRQPLPLRRVAAYLPLRLRAADVLLAVPPWMVGLFEVGFAPCFRTMVKQF